MNYYRQDHIMAATERDIKRQQQYTHSKSSNIHTTATVNYWLIDWAGFNVSTNTV